MNEVFKNESFWKYIGKDGKISKDAPKEAKEEFKNWKQPYKPANSKGKK